MKNLLVLSTLLSCIFAFSQQVEKSESNEKKSINFRKHELKIGGVKLLAGPILEVTYEYIQSKDFTYGSSFLLSLNENSDFNEKVSLTPFVRFYFQETKEYGAYGFFVEGFLKLASGNYQRDLFNRTKVDYTSGGVGLCVGKKWINNSGFVFETLIGGARGFGDGITAPTGYIRGDLFIGYRFN